MGVISGNHCKISFPFQTVLPCDTLSCAHNWWIKADKLCTLSFQVPYTHSLFTHTSPLCSMLLSIKQQHMHSRTIHWKLIENFEILASTLVFPPPARNNVTKFVPQTKFLPSHKSLKSTANIFCCQAYQIPVLLPACVAIDISSKNKISPTLNKRTPTAEFHFHRRFVRHQSGQTTTLSGKR